MKVGFTGTQIGMSDYQALTLRYLLTLNCASELHHGCCIGADSEAHEIAQDLGIWIVAHPPDKLDKEGECYQPDETRDRRPYLVRNRAIVDDSEFLIATPRDNTERRRSGTWYTVRYAKKQKVRWTVIPRYALETEV